MEMSTVFVATPDGTRPVVLDTVPEAFEATLDVTVEEVVEDKADAGKHAIRPFIPASRITLSAAVPVSEIRGVLESVEEQENVELTLPDADEEA